MIPERRCSAESWRSLWASRCEYSDTMWKLLIYFKIVLSLLEVFFVVFVFKKEFLQTHSLSSLLTLQPKTRKTTMPSKVTLYFTAGSPPARAVLLLARYLKVDVELKQVDLRAGEQKTESFAKLNPQGKVPVLVDGDFVLSESRAILAYLVNSRKPGSDLYPTDPKARALVDHRLYYDATSIFDKLIALVVSFFL